MLGLSRRNPLSLKRSEKFNTCGHCQFATFLASRLTLYRFATTLISLSDESGNLLNMIMDSGAEEHVVSLADWRSLCEPWLKAAQFRLRSATGDDMGVAGSFVVRGWCDNQTVELTALVATRATRSLCSATNLVNASNIIQMRPTQSVLRRSGGECILLQRCGRGDFLPIRVRKSREINAITFSTLKRKVQSHKSELRALRTGHMSTSEVRLPWTPEKKHRHEVNGHAEYDNRCEICVKSSSISKHPRRVYSESFAFDDASVTFKESDGYVTALTGRGPRDKCICRVVSRKGQRLKDLEHFLAVVRDPCLHPRFDNEEAVWRNKKPKKRTVSSRKAERLPHLRVFPGHWSQRLCRELCRPIYSCSSK